MHQSASKQRGAPKPLNYGVIARSLSNLFDKTINEIKNDFPEDRFGASAKCFYLASALVLRNTYASIFYLCAEKPKRFEKKDEFVLSSVPLVRVLIELLCNHLFVSEDVQKRLLWYDKSGWREIRENLDRYLKRYESDPDWEDYFSREKSMAEKAKSLCGITEEEEQNLKKIPFWPIPTQMLCQMKDPTCIELVQYLIDFFYREFSQDVHLSYPGLARMGVPLLEPKGTEEKATLERWRSDNVSFSILLSLAIISEMSAVLKEKPDQELINLWFIVKGNSLAGQTIYDMRYCGILSSGTFR